MQRGDKMKQIPENTYKEIVKSLAHLVDWDCKEGLIDQIKIDTIAVGIKLIGIALEKKLMDDVLNYCISYLDYFDLGFEECENSPFDEEEE